MDKENLVALIMKEIQECTDIPLDAMSEESAIMDDLDVSSLEIMMMIAGLEEKTHIIIPVSELRNVITIGDFADVILQIKK